MADIACSIANMLSSYHAWQFIVIYLFIMRDCLFCETYHWKRFVRSFHGFYFRSEIVDPLAYAIVVFFVIFLHKTSQCLLFKQSFGTRCHYNVFVKKYYWIGEKIIGMVHSVAFE